MSLSNRHSDTWRRLGPAARALVIGGLATTGFVLMGVYDICRRPGDFTPTIWP